VRQVAGSLAELADLIASLRIRREVVLGHLAREHQLRKPGPKVVVNVPGNASPFELEELLGF
jgi:hypothetical protein